MKLKKLFQTLWMLINISIGGILAALILNGLLQFNVLKGVTISGGTYFLGIVIGSAIGGLIGYLGMRPVYNRLETGIKWLQGRPFMDLIAGGTGLIAGLVIAFLLTQLTTMIQDGWLALLISILVYIIMGYTGTILALNHREGWRALIPGLRHRSRHKGMAEAEEEDEFASGEGSPKILDTSAIIDGRIFNIVATDFVEGVLVVPQFVLTELRHIADSADELKRNRGRRGLEVLNKMQGDLGGRVMVSKLDNDAIAEVDAKLVWLTGQLKGKLITNDYNLNQVAAVQQIPVLNINDLANALKPVALPGEKISVRIVKEGKEASQGVAYLTDGTMVVVDNGRSFMNEEVEVVVTSALQTSAGRMIFAKCVE